MLHERIEVPVEVSLETGAVAHGDRAAFLGRRCARPQEERAQREEGQSDSLQKLLRMVTCHCRGAAIVLVA